MRISPQAIEAIKLFEQFRPVAYRDGGGVWTCGYGHTLNVSPSSTCDHKLAETWLRQDLQAVDVAIKAAIPNAIPQNHLDAMASFALNVGTDAFANSTLVELYNQGQTKRACWELKRWDHDNGRQVRGLTIRRFAEELIWVSGAACINEELLEGLRNFF